LTCMTTWTTQGFDTYDYLDYSGLWAKFPWTDVESPKVRLFLLCI